MELVSSYIIHWHKHMTLATEHQEVDFTDVQFEKTWYCVMRDKEANQSQPNCHKSFKSTAQSYTSMQHG